MCVHMHDTSQFDITEFLIDPYHLTAFLHQKSPKTVSDYMKFLLFNVFNNEVVSNS